MKKHLRQLVALAMAVVMLCAMATTAMAAPTPAVPYTPGTGLFEIGNTLEISKRLVSASNTIAVPNETFTFAFAAVSVDEDTTPAIVSALPAISGISASTAAGDAWIWDSTDLVYYSTEKKSTTLNTALTSAAWPHAGVYVYTMTETAGATAGVTYSQEEYTVTIHVINGASGLEVYAVGFVKEKDFTGTAIGSPAKANPLFTNRIIQEAPLEISNTVTGAYGDLTKEFEYSITLTGIPGGPTSYTAVRLSSSGTVVGAVIPVPSGTATTFALKHGEKLVFSGSDGSSKLSAGVTYVLTETGVLKYTPSVGVVINGASALTELGSEGVSMTIGSGSYATTALNSPIAVGVGANSAAWTNDFSSPPTPTGILLDNLPFILLIIVGICGIVGYIALKRRRASR